MRRRDELAALLSEAARAAELPETPPLAQVVRRRIEAGPLPVATIRLPRTRPARLRPVLVVVTVLAVALGLTLSVSVTARRAVADLLGIVGIRVSFDGTPSVTPRPPGDIALGVPLSRRAAEDRAGFSVLVPRSEPGTPAFYFHEWVGDTGMVSVVYPRSARTAADVDVLVTQFVASIDEEFVKKLATTGSTVEYVSVGGTDGYWIGGEPHLFFYLDAEGDVRHESVRLAGKVLLWHEGGVTYRVEGARSLRAALRIADSLR